MRHDREWLHVAIGTWRKGECQHSWIACEGQGAEDAACEA